MSAANGAGTHLLQGGATASTGGERQFQLVVFADGPGLDAAVAKVLGEVRSKAVQRQHASRLHEVDEEVEVVETGVVGEREGGVAAVAEDR
jgi:hypothetical protein